MFTNMGIPAISPTDLKAKIDNNDDIFVLDVREVDEYKFCKISEKLIPLKLLPHKFQELPKNKEIVVYCHHGGRSLMACQFLADQGYNVFNLEGGIDLWSQQVDANCPRY